MQLCFTSGTTLRPKLVMHSKVTYPVEHLSTMYWIGLRPGDIHCNISSPGWAKHAWSCFFVPWNAEATAFVPNQSGYQQDDGTISPLEGAFHRTGDVMSRDGSGYYNFVGRGDDVFKASDYRICPFDLECALIEHPMVGECAVVPSPDSIRSAFPKTFVTLQSGVVTFWGQVKCICEMLDLPWSF
jgi:acyl-coenzyme A synthetase/AMP-(fatty) acid ligase